MKTLYSMTWIIITLLMVSFTTVAQEDEKEWLTGEITVEQITEKPENAWFEANYEAYAPDMDEVEVIQKIPENYEFVVIGGEWCHVTRANLPKLYKVIDLAAIPRDRVHVHFVNQHFDSEAEENLAEIYDIEGVPTFIILKDGKEVDRFAVYQDQTIEESMADLVAELLHDVNGAF